MSDASDRRRLLSGNNTRRYLTQAGALAAFLSLAFTAGAQQRGAKLAWVLVKSGVVAIDSDQGRIIARVGAEASPDIALSPDGDKLYVAGHSLSIVDASTGNILVSAPNPDFPSWIGPTPTSLIASSLDGKHLYIIKRRTTAGRDSTSTVSFDTARQVFDGTPVSIGDDCAGASLHVQSATELDIVCGGYNKIYIVTLGVDGTATQASAMQLPAPEGVLPTGEAHAKGDIRSTVWGPHGEVFLVKIDGKVLKVDTRRRLIVGTNPQPLQSALVPGGEGTLSPDAKRLFIGCSPPDDRSGLKTYIAVFDTQSLKLENMAPAQHRFRNIAWDPYRNELLLTVPEMQALVGVNPETLQQDRLLNVGGTPALIRFSRQAQ